MCLPNMVMVGIRESNYKIAHVETKIGNLKKLLLKCE